MKSSGDVTVLRVICTRAQSAPVIDLLSDVRGVTHLIRTRDAALSPPGDVIEAVIPRGLVQPLVDDLTELGVDESGEISFRDIDLVVSRTVDAACEDVTADSGADPLVWDELIEETDEGSELNPEFLIFLVIACLLAAIGVITHSAVLIVGAMVVSPDFGPLAGLAVAVVGQRRKLAAEATSAITVGFPVGIAATGLSALLARSAGILPGDSLDDLGSVSFVYQVGPYSLIVALLAGMAGMLALTSRKSTALVGVFISITTVPAAGFCALAAVNGDWSRSGEALLQLLINIAGVLVAGIITLWFRRAHVTGGPAVG
ncbi:DUF389 domain-containing protein [Corynebacterium sp. CCM 9186]|uniref:DUF389 domain-containing protein n=1 Tax=Corynebacterium meridianum TaxID=2765363 RepID=UPI002003B88B|nr:DUF389 domain-containing protein [Corynebacterium meridianum]MCK7677810.1 DUF389 domain-containing protein [Corynebacterium meridianum]